MQFKIFVIISLISLCAAWERHFVNENQDQLTHFYFINDQLRCNLYGDRNIIQQILSGISEDEIIKLDSMATMVKICADVELHLPATRRDFVQWSRAIIFPGTKWCGSGNVSKHYDDLGKYRETDMCCREHDHCPNTISAGKTKHGLTNNNIGAVSHCDCDDVFYDCLKSHETSISNKMGKMFFDLLGQKCFKLEYPIVQCLRWAGIGDSQCQEYELDYSQEKMWQFFDAKLYNV